MTSRTQPKPSPTVAPSRPDSGFSLIELMVALVVTLIVSGAVYGLLTSGQSAFRKEPAMADRQANIRSAMDLIVGDLRGAGSGMPPFTRVFTPGLDGASTDSTPPPNSPAGGLTDELEFVTESSSRTGQLVCAFSGTTIEVPEPETPIKKDDSFGIYLDKGEWTVRVATAVNTLAPGNASCPDVHTLITFGSGPIANVAGGICGAGGPGNTAGVGTCTPVMFSFARAVGYRIRYNGDGTPFLERRTSDDWGTWLQVLPGIEDLQVRYQLGPSGAAFRNVPNYATPVVTTANAPNATELDSLVRQVEVTLGARALGANLSGQQTAAGGVANAPRGRLVSITAMRPVLETLSTPGLPSPYPMRF